MTQQVDSKILGNITRATVEGFPVKVKTEFGEVDVEDAAILQEYRRAVRDIACDPLETSFEPNLKKTLHKLAVLNPSGFVRAVEDVFWSKTVSVDLPRELSECDSIFETIANALDSGMISDLAESVRQWDRNRMVMTNKTGAKDRPPLAVTLKMIKIEPNRLVTD